MSTYVILENIRSAHNVGAIFRTADGAGVSKIFIVGYTPAPTDRFGRTQPEILKTSLGATKTIPWEYVEASGNLIKKLQAEGVTVVAVEQTSDAQLYTTAHTGAVAFVFGNEIEGVSEAALAAADMTVHVPMSGQKESLNVATTAGIILFTHRDG